MDGLRTAGIGALVLIGLLGMEADLAGNGWLRDFAAATGAAPVPAPFSAAGGFEPHEHILSIEWVAPGDRVVRTATPGPEAWARVRGPHDLRHAWAAALFSAPALPAYVVAPVFARALCGAAPLVAEMGLPLPVAGERLRLRWEVRDIVPDLVLVTITQDVPCP